MPNDYRDRQNWRDRDQGRDRWRDQNRGAFGYEGEGFMRGGGRDVERDYDRQRDREYGGRDDYTTSFTGGGFGTGGYDDWQRRGEMNPNTQRQSFRGRGPKNYQRSDERIREDICERLTHDERVDATEIEVQVQGATVTLEGSVDDREQKRRAEDVAESVRGVREVQNHLRLGRAQ